jgi:hypothetical protein
MSEWEGTEDAGAAVAVSLAPVAELPEIKLFNKWSCDEVQVADMSLQDYIAVKEKVCKVSATFCWKICSQEVSKSTMSNCRTIDQQFDDAWTQ